MPIIEKSKSACVSKSEKNKISLISPIFAAKRLLAFVILLLQFVNPTHAEDVNLRHSFAGNLSFELAGNTMRRTNNTCNSRNQTSSTITLPANSTIEAAFLYWSGSGGIDSSVSLNNQTINADITYTLTPGGLTYYSAKADITALVSNTTATYTLSNLSFDGSAPYCNSGGAYGGWAMAVIYEQSSEPLRVVNLFDGFRRFQGQSFDLIPDNFVIASNPASLGGKHAHITWEGDSGNSQSLNGFNEELDFQGIELTDAGNPASNQFNGFSNVQGNTSGVDIDEYQIGSSLIAGATSVTTTYSSGQDAVFLTAELISVPNEPVANLSIQQTASTTMLRGQSNSVVFNIENLGPNNASANANLTFALPNGVSFLNATGSNWSCQQLSNNISCLYASTMNDGGAASSLTINLLPGSTANSNFNLTATITGLEFDNVLTNNTSITNFTVINPDYSTSTKTVTDINGGNVQPGDTLRYKIDIIETNGVASSSVVLTDNIPANISSFSLVSSLTGPLAGAVNNSQTAPAGNNGTGLLSISNISVPANSTVSIEFDAVINSSAAANTAINNTAEISAAGLASITASSATIFVSQPSNPAGGNKPLYVRQNNTLSRLQPTSNAFISLADNAQNTWDITPSFQTQFEFSASNVSAYLFLQNDFTSGSWGHTVTATLLRNGAAIGSVQRTITVPSQAVAGDNIALFEFTIPLTSTPTLQIGDTLSLRITNDSEYAVDSLRIYSIDGNPSTGDAVTPHSLVSLPAATVINVDEIEILNNNISISEASAGDALTIQSTISDPFGSFDITAATISITDAQGNDLINTQAMSVLSDSGAATKTYHFDYAIPNNAATGNWQFEITALEGIENEISHSSTFTLNITEPLPNITLTKNVAIESDPINGTNSPKALPGAEFIYTITARNSGPGVAQNNSIFISDAVPENTELFVGDLLAGAPFSFNTTFTNGTPSSTLTFTFNSLNSATDDVSFSSDNGANFSYTPTPDSDGYDSQVTHFRLNPKGIFAAPTGSTPTQFDVQFRIRLK